MGGYCNIQYSFVANFACLYQEAMEAKNDECAVA